MGYKELEPVMLFDLTNDPHEQHDWRRAPEVVDRAMALLADWQHAMMLRSPANVGPADDRVAGRGPFHTRGMLPRYLERLRTTGRGQHAARLAARHPEAL